MNTHCDNIENNIFGYIGLKDIIICREINREYNRKILLLIKEKRKRHVLSIGWYNYWYNFLKKKDIENMIRSNSIYVNEVKQNREECGCKFDSNKKSPCEIIKKLRINKECGMEEIMWYIVHGREDDALRILKNNDEIVDEIQEINKFIGIGCYIKIAKYLREKNIKNLKYSNYLYNEYCDLLFYYQLYLVNKEDQYIQTISNIINTNRSLVEKNTDKIVEIINNIGDKKLILSFEFIQNFINESVDKNFIYDFIEKSLCKDRYYSKQYLIKPTIFCIKNGNIKLLMIIIDKIKNDYDRYKVFDKCVDYCIENNLIEPLKILPLGFSLLKEIEKCIELNRIQCIDILTSNPEYKKVNNEKILINCIESKNFNYIQYLSRQSTYDIYNIVKLCIDKISNIFCRNTTITHIINNNTTSHYNPNTLQKLIHCLATNKIICCLVLVLKHKSFKVDSITQNILNNIVYDHVISNTIDDNIIYISTFLKNILNKSTQKL